MSVCLNLGFTKMGNCTEGQSKISIDTDSLSVNVSEFIMSAVLESTTDTAILQDQNITIRGKCCSNSLTIEQGAKLKIIDKTKFTVNFAQDILKKMAEEYNKKLEASSPYIDQIFGNQHGQPIKTAIKTSIINSSQTTMSQSALTQTLNTVIGNQYQTIIIKCNEYLPDNTTCVINQNFLLKQVITNTYEVIFKQVLVDPEVVNAINNGLANRFRQSILVYTEPWWKNTLTIVILFSILTILIVITFIKLTF